MEEGGTMREYQVQAIKRIVNQHVKDRVARAMVTELCDIELRKIQARWQEAYERRTELSTPELEKLVAT